MYEKPVLRSYGSFRELTLIGIGANGDGGIFGSGLLDACWVGCRS